MEASYLAKKAGYEITVIDRRSNAPALALADNILIADVVKDYDIVKEAVLKCDAVLPACENLDMLETLTDIVKGSNIPLLFDLNAYRISCSKKESNDIMEKIGVPIPQPWPECGYPAIVKPSSQSGSIGVKVVENEEDLEDGLKFIEEIGDVPVMQEFVSGRSISIEVIGNGKTATSYVTTEVVLDSGYDCKMVRCHPDIISPEQNTEFAKIGKDIAEFIKLEALMDVEAIVTSKGLRVLEIDSRIPSQTPAAIFAATGINLLEEWVCTALKLEHPTYKGLGAAAYEHFVIKDGKITACGEKEFSHVNNPRIVNGLFGSDDMITDYEEGKSEWRVTMITSGKTMEEVDKRRLSIIHNIMEKCNLSEHVDPTPEMI